MMALAAPQVNERKRVKVYELKSNDWYDRGTGFCAGQIIGEPSEARILVQSEDDPARHLLETRISRDDGYQKQQETLIVWNGQSGVDMALSFQEAEGCAAIWEFVSEIQGRLAALAPDDGLSDDMIDSLNPIMLPQPELGKLEEIENMMRAASTTPAGRDALAKFIMSPDQKYIEKLAPLVEMAEDLESLPDLHRLCNIMKTLILLNDTSIIEHVVKDEAIMGVVGALEYDPDFPSHRANHRQYLSDESKFKEVVRIEDPDIRKKIHYTYRLLYLKDVVLARILDDPTFSVLNSLIFFHQVDIVNHLQGNGEFLQELFAIFSPQQQDPQKKKEAVLFIQNCCAVAKNIQAPSRNALYQNFINGGLFGVITFALRHHDAAVRVAGTDILVALIDHDPHMMRNHIFNAIIENMKPLTDTLIELLLVEVDLGVKSQMADAIKILLDPSSNSASIEMLNRTNSEFLAKARNAPANMPQPQTEAFIQSFYDDSARKLFQPLKDLEFRENLQKLTVQEASLYTHLVEVLCFFVRSHSFKSKLFILSENLHCRVAQLLNCPQKHMKLTALKWFRTCVGLQDEFHNRQLMQHRLFEPILNLVYETMPRDNLLNSACLEMFEFIKRQSIKPLILHLVEQYRERLLAITYVNTFQSIVLRYDQFQSGYPISNGDQTPQRTVNGGRPYTPGLKEVDPEEEAYFTNPDDEDDEDGGLPTAANTKPLTNGTWPLRPLVNYPDDDEDAMDILASSPDTPKEKKSSSSSDEAPSTEPTDDSEPQRGRSRTPVQVYGSPGRQSPSRTPVQVYGSPDRHSPPEPVAVKRRREDDDEDELARMMGGGPKRRNSVFDLNGGKNNSAAIATTNDENALPSHGHMLRRKGSLKTKDGGSKIVVKPINLAVKSADGRGEGGGGGD